ncbi:MAG: glycosyltransferase family 2 protein, partial [Actinobacteria bacterium]|nr:glycosyltransferase family 2 protein [Actinomycetota bacterium]
AEHLPACLAPLPDNANVVVVDNASGDEAPDLAERAGATVVRNPTNRGFAAAANQGARMGSGDALLFLNPDAVVDRADLSTLLATLAGDPALGAVGPRLVSPHGHEQRAWWPFPSPLATWAEALGLHRLWHGAGKEAPGFLVGACLLARRAAVEEVGGFDERFWLYGEDADLCRRLWNAGWSVRLVPDATALHIGGASGESVSDMTFEHFQRGAEHFIQKHHGAAGLVLHRLGLLVGSVLRLPVLLLRPDDPRGDRRWRMIRRDLHHLLTRPTRVEARP